MCVWVLTATLVCGASVFMSCSSNDDNPSTVDISVMEKNLVGLWWDEFEYADITEAGVPFSRVLLAVKANADHTGCIYLGVYDDISNDPLAVYGGPEDAGFKWRLLDDGRILLSDPVTGESYALARTRADGGSYGDGMTDVKKTSLVYTDGSVTVDNGDYSGTLTKADAEKEADIAESLSTLSPDRQNFEAQLSKMLQESQKYIKLDPTMRAVNLLTEFIDQLKIEALKPQLVNILVGIISKPEFGKMIPLDTPEAEEARWALANSNIPNDAAKEFIQLNADVVLNNTKLEFTTGKDTADYVATDDGTFTVSCKNATSSAVTKVKMKFSGATDGVIIFLVDLSGIPIAIQFPHTIDMELLRSETGNDADEELVVKGQLSLESTDGQKYISLKRSEWKATLFTEAQKADRYEMPACTLIHHADHTVEFSASLGINGNNVMSIKGHNFNNPYADEELEQLRELRDIAPIWKGCYTLLKAFNSRTDKIELTVTDDLLFDIDILDVGQCLKAVGNAMKYRKQQPLKETMDPWTDLLNQSVTFNVTQKSTGVKAEGKFITSVIAGNSLPSVALRFKGESDFRVIHDRMSPTDRQNYEALLKSFNEPLTAVNALLKVIQDKGEEFKAIK
jgi:hypothetical protein